MQCFCTDSEVIVEGSNHVIYWCVLTANIVPHDLLCSYLPSQVGLILGCMLLREQNLVPFIHLDSLHDLFNKMLWRCRMEDET